MQPQSTQNMYAPPGTNGSGNVRTNQQSNIYRQSTNGAPRAGARQMPMHTMYQQTVQGLVLPTFTQYTPRQPSFQTPSPFTYPQSIQPFPYTTSIQYPFVTQMHPPQAHQRGAVNVNASVNNSLSVQNGSNAQMPGSLGGTQVPMSLAPAVLTSGVTPGSNGVLGVSAASSTVQQVGVTPIVSVVPQAVTSQNTQSHHSRRRKHALDIIDPNTNQKVDVEDLTTHKNSAYEVDQIPVSAVKLSESQVHLLQDNRSNNVFVVSSESNTSLPFGLDTNLMSKSKKSDNLATGQTPVVSAISDAPSVEILPHSQKLKIKKNTTVTTYPNDESASIRTSFNSDRIQDLENIQITEIIKDSVPKNQDLIQCCGDTGESSNIRETDTDKNLVGISPLSEKNDDNINKYFSKNVEVHTLSAAESPEEHSKITPVTELQNQISNNSSSEETNNYTLNTMKLTENVEIVHAPNDLPQLEKKEIYANNSSNEGKEESIVKVASEKSILEVKATNDLLKQNNKNPAQILSKPQTYVRTPFEVPDVVEPKISAVDSDLDNPVITVNNVGDINEWTESSTEVVPENSELKNSVSILPKENSKPVVSLIKYNEGQWSPKNPTGRKQYDREQLIRLRDAIASRIQPEVKNTSILPQPSLMPSFMRNNTKRVQSMVGSIGGKTNFENNNFIGKQSSMSGVHARNSMKAMIHVNLSLNQDVKLNETDNAWRPRALAKGTEVEIMPEEKFKREKDDLIRRVRGILNKLTPEKFDALVEEIIKLKIDTPDKMEDVMVLVFEKAIDEPNFSVSYARLCHRLITEVKARDERMESGTKTNLAHFRNALLDKTEREFTQNVTQSSAKEKKLQPIIDKIKMCMDPNEKAELEAILEEEERKIRRRSGGTVRFIGELFKISMLTGKIICSCIENLLKPNSEDMLECLCKLLTTVGAKYEQTIMNSKESATRCYSLEKTMIRMQAIALKTDKEGSKVSSRVRFMLQDVIDLRKNKWHSARNEAPKTMEQIEKEAKTEHLSSQFINYSGSVSSGLGLSGSNNSSTKRDDRIAQRFNESRSSVGYHGSHSQRNDMGSLRRQQQSGNTGVGNSNNNDEWHVQTSKGSRSVLVDTNKLEILLSQNADIGSKKMGGLSQFQWNMNSSRQSSSSTSVPSNSFAALSSLPDTNKGSDRDRDRSGPRNKGSYNKGSVERDRYGDRGNHSRVGGPQSSRDDSSSRNSQGKNRMLNPSSLQKSASNPKYPQPGTRPQSKTSATSSSSKASLYSYREDQVSTTSLPTTHLDTFVSTYPSVAPVAVFRELDEIEEKTVKSVISNMIEIAVDSKILNSTLVPCINKIKESQRCGFLYYILTNYLHLRQVGQTCRRHLANVIIYLLEKNFLSKDHFTISYEKFCEISGDLIFDIPELWLYIFEFTGPLIVKNIITINDLWIKQLKEDRYKLGPKFLRTFLTYCTREIGPRFTRNMWKQCNMKWTDFVPKNDVELFIESNSLGYVENEELEVIVNEKEAHEKRLSRVYERIERMLWEKSDKDSIIDYINGNVTGIDKSFIRNLTEKLCNSSLSFIDGSYKLDVELYKNNSIPILQRYIDTNEDLELECLYSMQHLVHNLEHPRGILGELFFELYDADVIPPESFIKWRDCHDQSAGKGVAVKGLNPFFNHILQSGETSDENN